MDNQIANTIMMVRPAAFLMNEETAVNNFFQQKDETVSLEQIQSKALAEFDGFVDQLKAKGVDVLVFQDKAEDQTPDSIFPNNWNSFHEDGSLYLYPMFAENRRRERKTEILDHIRENFEITSEHSFAHWESENCFLEGTGSMILDRPNKLAYAAISLRTQMPVLEDFAQKTGFELVTFTANQTVGEERLPIYHTNVMMCLGEHFVVLCADCIDDPSERAAVLNQLQKTGKELVLISEAQRDQFAGNMLQVKNAKGDRFVVMSDSAYQSLKDSQRALISAHGEIIHPDLSTIEKYGGGSARCMMGEVFLKRR